MLGRNYFTARFKGKCYFCGTDIEIGDKAFYPVGREHVIGMMCCDDRADSELIYAANEHVPLSAEEQLLVRTIDVMPHGKTARDMCRTCFQVPAANGFCGCMEGR